MSRSSWTLSQAAGRDPADARDKAKGALTLAAGMSEFLEQHSAKLKASTAGEYRRLIRLYLPKNLRSRPLAEMKRADIARLHLSLRDKLYQGNRLIALLSNRAHRAHLGGARTEEVKCSTPWKKRVRTSAV